MGRSMENDDSRRDRRVVYIVQGDRRCAALSRSVQRAKRTGSTAGLGRTTLRSELLQNLGMAFGDPKKGFCRA